MTGVKTIPLTQGQVAIVSQEDYDRIAAFDWYAAWSKFTESFYAQRHITLPSGKQGTVRMHREILGLKRGDGRKCDHANGDTLDNTRENLRVATIAQNNRNIRIPRHNTSGVKGVSWDPKMKKWRARIRVNGVLMHLGFFDDFAIAGIAYADAARKHHGEFARLK